MTTKNNFTSCSCPNLSLSSQNDEFSQQIQKGFQDAAKMYHDYMEGSQHLYHKNRPTLPLLCTYYCGIRNEQPEISYQKRFEELYEENEDENPFENKGF